MSELEDPDPDEVAANEAEASRYRCPRDGTRLWIDVLGSIYCPNCPYEQDPLT